MASSTVKYMSTALDVYAADGAFDPSAGYQELLRTLPGDALAVMLYGSHARGAARPDSDIDILQIVAEKPGSYSLGRINVTAYTAEHLQLMAQRGSLFVRHLRDEGLTLSDLHGVLAQALDQYQPPVDGYDRLKKELAVALSGLTASCGEPFAKGLLRLGVFVVRSALYLRGAEAGNLTFDIEVASSRERMPRLVRLLRMSQPGDEPNLYREGMRLLGTEAPTGRPSDLPSLAVWARDNYPLAATLLESVIAGRSEIDYTAMTLPAV